MVYYNGFWYANKKESSEHYASILSSFANEQMLETPEISIPVCKQTVSYLQVNYILTIINSWL